MKKFFLPYHFSQLSIKLPDNLIVDVYSEKDMQADPDPELATENALSLLACDQLLPGRARKTISVAIAINDNTRPVPHQYILPPLLRWLNDLRISPQQITFFVATGTHKELTPDEIAHILPGDTAQYYKVLSHNCDNVGGLIYLGKTANETPVWINREYYQSDFKIVIGNIEPHHFMGYSGGVKTASIGLAGRDTITKNHKMLLLPEARAGSFDKNPMRMDIEEIGRMACIHLALNIILNKDKNISSVFAGKPVDVMRKGIAIVREQMMTRVTDLYDIVIASAGGYPKDINLYQAQKAMTHASYFAANGGTIILAAACSEGLGSKSFNNFVSDIGSAQEILDYFATHPFQIGPHKALQIVKITKDKKVILKSEINKDIPKYLLDTTNDIQQLINKTLPTTGIMPRIALLPSATHVIPYDS